MSDEKIKVRFKGTVRGHFYGEEGRRTITVNITPAQTEKLWDLISKANFMWDGDSVALKTDENGNNYVKLSTLYSVSAHDLPMGYTIDDIGKDSEVEVCGILKEASFRQNKVRRRYVGGYLTAVKVIKLVEREEFSPFDDEETTEI